MLRPVRLVLPCLLLAALSGCGDRDIVTAYSVPRANDRGAETEYRILGAIYPADKPMWYFKLTGPAAELAKHEADFDTFIASVRLKAGEEVPDFTLPAGWKTAGPRSSTMMGITQVYDQTIKIGTLELTISRSAAGVQGNIERWAGQVGHLGVAMNATRDFAAGPIKGIRVDVKGPKDPTAGPMMKGKR